MLARTVAMIAILAAVVLASGIFVSISRADMCLPASQWQSLSGLTKMTMNGQEYYCNLQNPPGSPSTSGCPNTGEVPITAATREAATKAGIPTSATCWKPTDQNVGQEVGEAKKYLRSLMAGSGSCTSADQQIEMLNAAYAQCAAQFLKAYQQSGGSPKITRAGNTVQCEAKMCVNNPGCGGFNNNPAPQSNHTRGYAMDVTSSNQDAMTKFAQQNPQYGVCFPFTSGRFIDKVHLILKGAPGSEGNGPGCSGVQSVCSGVKFDPNAAPPSPTTTPPPPSSGPDSPVQQPQTPLSSLFGPQQQPSPQLPPPPPPQPLPSQPQLPAPTQPAQSTLPISTQLPVSSQLTTQAGSSTSILNSNTNTNTNTNDEIDAMDTGVIGDVSSSYTDIQTYAGDDLVSSAIDIGSAYEISLNGDTEDVATLDGEPAETQSGAIRYASSSPTASIAAPQTFTSPDLAYSPIYANTSSDNTFVQNALTILKNAVLLGLNYLKPFGGQVPATYSSVY